MKRVAIVGAGPAGLAAAKAFALEPARFVIDLFERRNAIGGVWLYQGDKTKVRPPVPSTDPDGHEILLPDGGHENRFFSSMYENLETNLIDTLMEYSNLPFKPRSRNFIDRTDVLRYLQAYAKTIPKIVNYHFNTNVTDVTKVGAGSRWQVTTKDEILSTTSKNEYDAVVVANGHSEFPFIPDTPGLKTWSQKDPESVTHSKYFRSSSDFKNKTVLIIGNYASGMDLATQISTTATKVFVSTKDDIVQGSLCDSVQHVKLITSYDVSQRAARTIDNNILKNIDLIVFCTGYLYTLPFFRNFKLRITDGVSVNSLFKQMFFLNDPSLSFIGLPKFVSPLPLCESQAAVIARTVSGRIMLPSFPEMQRDYEKELASKGGGKNFHSLKDCDHTYCNELFEWIKRSKSASEGLLPLYWTDQKIQDRRNVANFKEKRTDHIVKNARFLRTQGKEFAFPPLGPPQEATEYTEGS